MAQTTLGTKRLIEYGIAHAPVDEAVAKKQRVVATFDCPTTGADQRKCLDEIQLALVRIQELCDEMNGVTAPFAILVGQADPPRISIQSQKLSLVFQGHVALEFKENSPKEACTLTCIQRFMPLLKEDAQIKFLDQMRVDFQAQILNLNRLKQLLADWKRATTTALPVDSMFQSITPDGLRPLLKGQAFTFEKGPPLVVMRLNEWLMVAMNILYIWMH